MKFLVEIEIEGPLEADLRAADMVGGCLMIERMVRRGLLSFVGITNWQGAEKFLTVRAMEHVTVPTGRVP